MKEGFIIRDQAKAHFITMTVVDWIDIFSRKIYRDIVVDSLNYCIENKGMILYGSRRGAGDPDEAGGGRPRRSGPNPYNSSIDVFCADCYTGGNRLLLEYKYGPTSITKDVILTQFIERDLFNPDITSINQIQWRLKDTGFTKEILYYCLSNDVECRTAIEKLGKQKIALLLNDNTILQGSKSQAATKLIDYLNIDNNFNLIFR